MKRLLVGLAVVAALGSAAPAEASTPMPWCGVGSSDSRPPARRHARLRGPRRVRASARSRRPPGGVGAADRRRRRCDRRVVALAGPDALAALRSLPVRLREPVRTARHLQRDAAAGGRADQHRVHDDPLPACPARVHPAREDLPRLLRRPGGAAGARVRGLRRRRHPIRWATGDRDRLPPGVRRRRAARYARSSACTSSCIPSAPSRARLRTTAATGTCAMSPTTC